MYPGHRRHRGRAEARIYARYILETKPHAKIGILYQNDDYGKDYLKGMKDGLGDRAASMIVKEVSYEVTDPTIDSQIVSLQASGADVFFNVTTPKFAAQAIRKAYDIGWKPVHFLNGVSVSRSAVLAPAGFEKAKDIITSIYLIDPNDPQWSDEPESRVWSAWMDKYNPEGNKADAGNVYGYALASTLVQVLNQCGDNLTRENVMAQAANLKGFRAPMLLPGITINTSPSDYAPVKQMQLARFDGEKWVPFGEVLGVDR
jgi:branched-chain amino acid transport system substrate-binding protein